MENKNPSSEEIQKRREFAYRAYSPDSEPPSPLHSDKHDQTEPVRQEERTEADKKVLRDKRQGA